MSSTYPTPGPNPFQGNPGGTNPLFEGVWSVLGPEIQRNRDVAATVQDAQIKQAMDVLHTPGLSDEDFAAWTDVLNKATSKLPKEAKDSLMNQVQMHRTLMKPLNDNYPVKPSVPPVPAAATAQTGGATPTSTSAPATPTYSLCNLIYPTVSGHLTEPRTN